MSNNSTCTNDRDVVDGGLGVGIDSNNNCIVVTAVANNLDTYSKIYKKYYSSRHANHYQIRY